MSGGEILFARQLEVAYGATPVFSGVRLALAAGLHVLQGPNGSGKSTLLRVLAGAQAPKRGSVVVDGFDLQTAPREARLRLAYVPDESPIYDFMTGRQFLEFVARSKGLALGAAVTQFAHDLGLSSFLDTRHDKLSLGTRKKLLLCAALVGCPRVILLDEPTNALDEPASAVIRTRLAAWAESAAVLCVSHDRSLVLESGAHAMTMREIAHDPL